MLDGELYPTEENLAASADLPPGADHSLSVRDDDEGVVVVRKVSYGYSDLKIVVKD